MQQCLKACFSAARFFLTSCTRLQKQPDNIQISSEQAASRLTFIPFSYAMAPSKNEARLCDSSNCERWWLNADYMHGMGGQRWLKCPYCRRASPKATKFWLGGHAGPKDPSYDYPGRLLPSRLSQERIVLKRPTPVDTSVSSPRPTKAPRSQEVSPLSSIITR